MNINQILHIGDDPINDVRGAVDAGAHAIWFNKKGLAWSEKMSKPVVIDDWKKGYVQIKKIMSSKETVKAIIEVLKDKTQDINHVNDEVISSLHEQITKIIESMGYVKQEKNMRACFK